MGDGRSLTWADDWAPEWKDVLQLENTGCSPEKPHRTHLYFPDTSVNLSVVPITPRRISLVILHACEFS